MPGTSDAAPPMVPAMCVPWPYGSTLVRLMPPVKSAKPTMRLPKSGDRRMPESITATVTPVPSSGLVEVALSMPSVRRSV